MKFKLPFLTKSVRSSELLPQWKTSQPQSFATWNDWSTDRAIQYGYKVNGYVYACINLIASAAASIPWEVYKKVGYKKWEVVEDHPLALLLENPNPFVSRKEFIERLTIHMYLGGNSILTKVRSGKEVKELWALAPDAIKIQPSKQDFIDRYVYEKDGVKMAFDPKDIIHSKFTDPSNPYWGMSPLQAGAKVVDTDTEAQTWNKISLENRAITDGIFTFEHPLTQEQWAQARAMIREQHQGIANARSPWVLGAGATWQAMALSPQEMDFINTRKMTREEICSIFGVPPVMVGVYENATLANIETARKIFWQDTVVPFLDSLKGCFNLQLLPDFDPSLYLDYDLSSVEALQESFNDKMNNAKALWSMGVPLNMINQRLELGFDDILGGDNSFLPSGLTMVDPATGLPIVPEKPANDPSSASGDNLDGQEPPAGKKAYNLKYEEQKDAYANSVEERREKWHGKLVRKTEDIFLDEADLVIAALKSSDAKTKESVEAAIEKAIDMDRWTKFYETQWTGIVREFGQATLTELKAYKPAEIKSLFGITDAIRKYIMKQAGEKVRAVSDFTKSVIGGIVLNAFEKDQGMDEIAKSIKKTYFDFSGYRAYRIARTEVSAASNYGSLEAAKMTGLGLYKQWWTAEDNRVRDSHRAMHGEVVPVDKQFSNGMDYPAEYGYTDAINCRCVTIYEPE